MLYLAHTQRTPDRFRLSATLNRLEARWGSNSSVFEETGAYLVRRSSPTGIMCSWAEPQPRRRMVSTFPTKILLATDGSKDAKQAARTAADLAEKTGSEVHVVYVGGGGLLRTPPARLST